MTENQKALKDVIIKYSEEFRWIDESTFCVWIPFCFFRDFMVMIKQLITIDPYNSECDAQIQSDCICIELTKNLFEEYEIEEMFPKDGDDQ